jgi:membrane associated rhomboid family serine protease
MGDRSYRGFSLNAIWIIIAVNFLLFIVTTISREVIILLGLAPILFVDRPWTIVTNLFIHVGFWHLFINMLTFYFFGTYLSRLVGQGRFLQVYFIGGILGNIFYISWGDPISIAVGASGAVFALAGALVMLVPKLRVFIFPIPVPMPLWLAVVGVFVLLTALAMPLNIAWEAHLGGLFAGLVTGFFFRRRRRYYSLR